MSELNKVLILALGGEGGGTLTEWIVEAGRTMGWPIQATSIPGVAQRTGGTSYYIECLPRRLTANEKAPSMCLAPMAGDIDLIISSELLETARALERGMSSPKKTHVISSIARSLTTIERIAQSDGRFSNDAIIETARVTSKSFHSFDMTALAKQNGTVVSSVMLGALVASGVLPFSQSACEAAIGVESGSSPSGRIKSTLDGFNAGLLSLAATPSEDKSDLPSAPVPEAANAKPIHGVALPGAVATIARHGYARLTDYLDNDYAEQYLRLVAEIAALDSGDYLASKEAARTLAIWMSYEDIVRVADLKSRASRFEQIRSDYQAKPHEPVVVRDFLKPGIAEIADVLPSWLASKLSPLAGRTIGQGMELNTSSLNGLVLMRVLASMWRFRRQSSRFHVEHALIERWLATLHSALRSGHTASAISLAKLPALIKGYSDTHARGKRSFIQILETIAEPSARTGAWTEETALQMNRALSAAQNSTDGVELADILQIERPRKAPVAQPIHFYRPQRKA